MIRAKTAADTETESEVENGTGGGGALGASGLPGGGAAAGVGGGGAGEGAAGIKSGGSSPRKKGSGTSHNRYCMKSIPQILAGISNFFMHNYSNGMVNFELPPVRRDLDGMPPIEERKCPVSGCDSSGHLGMS